MNFFLTKEFHEYGLDTAEYWKCSECGLVASKTHVEMSPAQWENINHLVHSGYQGTEFDANDPRWYSRIETQARLLNDVQEIGLLNRNDRWLDYACGDARLSRLLRRQYNLNLLNYERYMPKREGFVDESELLRQGFDFVITTAVFEHLTHREEFDFVEGLLSRNGVLGLHTLVCENVPADPSWFYMNPAHGTFHTNRSMEILFRQWGYTSSVYNVDAQLWLWFKTNPEHVQAVIAQANTRADRPTYVFKRGFVDYWKCAPYRTNSTVSS